MKRSGRRGDLRGPATDPLNDYLDCMASALARWWLKRCTSGNTPPRGALKSPYTNEPAAGSGIEATEETTG